MFRLALLLSSLSLIAMVVIDRALGARAGYLNAWSVVERLLGRSPSAGTSLVAARTGGLGELVVVVVANPLLGTLLAGVARVAVRLLR